MSFILDPLEFKLQRNNKIDQNIDSMFSVRVVPWHGMGKVIDKAPNATDAIKLAGLDWGVRDTYNKDSKYIYREDNSYLLSTMPKNHITMSNSEAFKFLDYLLEEEIRYETAGSLNGGKNVWLLVKLPYEYVVGDAVIPYLVFHHRYDSYEGMCAITPVRVVCRNTLNFSLQTAQRKWTFKYTKNYKEQVEEAKLMLKLAHLYMDGLRAYAEDMQQTKIRGPKDFTNNNDIVYRYHKAPDLEVFGDTAWRLLNAVSDHYNHYPKYKRIEIFNRFFYDDEIFEYYQKLLGRDMFVNSGDYSLVGGDFFVSNNDKRYDYYEC